MRHHLMWDLGTQSTRVPWEDRLRGKPSVSQGKKL